MVRTSTLGLGLLLMMVFITGAFAAERVVVCEEAYSEG
jgi:hypothetical protein